MKSYYSKLFSGEERAKEIFENALSIANRIDDEELKGEALSAIAMEFVKVDIGRAISVANRIDYVWCKSAAFVAIVDKIVEEDVEKAIRGKIAKVYPKRTTGFVDRIEVTDHKISAIAAMASKVAKLNMGSAKKMFELAINLTNRFKYEFRKIIPLSDIAFKLAKVDREQAKEIFEQAINIAKRYPLMSSDIMTVATRVVKVDADRAISIANSIRSDHMKAIALGVIAGEVAKADLKRAKEIFKQAMNITDRIEVKGTKVMALSIIAGELAKVDGEQAKEIFEQAINIANGVNDEFQRGNLLSLTSGELAKVDVERAMNIADRIEDEELKEKSKVEIYAKIASELAESMSNFDEVLSEMHAEIQRFENNSEILELYNQLANVDRNDVQKIKQLVRNIDEKISVMRRKTEINQKMFK